LISATGIPGICKNLTKDFNQFVDEYLEEKIRKKGQENVITQLNLALMNLNESVIIIDAERNIQLVNEASKKWLAGRGHNIQGRAIEEVFRNSELIEFCYALIEGNLGSGSKKTIRIQREGNGVLWFEVTGAHIENPIEGKQMFLVVLHDITQLTELEAVRKDFVANVSHELRTPITVIKGFAETLAEDEGGLSEAMSKKFIDKIDKNAKRLHSLVEDLLTLSRLESGVHVPELQKVSLRDICYEVSENYNLQEKNFDKPVRFVEGEDPAWVMANKNQIIQVLENVVDNAYRYAGNFTQITINLQSEQIGEVSFWKCSICDDGVGIPKKDQARVFERFYRVDKSRSTQSGGTGLGLSIVKHITQLHGGVVSISSQEGKGTCVNMSIPQLKS
jgi:PAS domain S-box-containing protein